MLTGNIYSNMKSQSFENETFKDCEFIDPFELARLEDCRFINCIFINCSFRVDAVYCLFLGCTFSNCDFGNIESRKDYSRFYKCNMDKCIIDKMHGVKLKACSFNGADISSLDYATIVKCCHVFSSIKMMDNVSMVSRKNTTKVIRSKSTKRGKRKVFNGRSNNIRPVTISQSGSVIEPSESKEE